LGCHYGTYGSIEFHNSSITEDYSVVQK